LARLHICSFLDDDHKAVKNIVRASPAMALAMSMHLIMNQLTLAGKKKQQKQQYYDSDSFSRDSDSGGWGGWGGYGGYDRYGVQCWRCGEYGHKRYDCWN
jgi:hypothetical protein